MEKSRKKLPAGWEMKTLGEVCELINRGISPRYIESGGLRVFNQKCIRDHKVNMELGRYHDNLTKIVPEERYIKYGDVLVNSTGTGTLGRVAQVLFDSNATVDSHVTIVRPKPNLFVLPYFGYGMIAIEEEIAQRGQGCGGQIELSRDDLKKTFYLSYPQSHYEQQRIVAKLDEAFAEIATAKANIERNLQNCKEVFQCELNAMFANKGKDWKEEKLSKICEVKDGTHDSPKYILKGIPFITQKNIKEDGLNFDNIKYINQIDHDKFYKRSNVTFGDILISMIGANRGMACIVDSNEIFSIKNVGLIKASKNINSHYLLYYLKSNKSISFIKSFSKGGAQEFIGLTELRNFPIITTSQEIQKNIVSRLDKLYFESKQLEQAYQQKLSSLEELKKSILQKAFSGELK